MTIKGFEVGDRIRHPIGIRLTGTVLQVDSSESWCSMHKEKDTPIQVRRDDGGYSS